ncbi:AMP-binding protein [Mycolicibacterium frederiksbergense]|uniref:AMP-binding protein n=1 Tax=Mycolicibacterium frederiksbergense TaxID=117567 RepID=UPI00265C4A50|nr:AMP-binding protein [Mycolicibacterium frederiksbergense]MDO0976858.1 AMP-binding protein [Mycolicibacterium frederiksbergense]
MVGQHDERVSAVIKDSAPSLILTTSAVAATVAEYAKTESAEGEGTAAAAAVIEVDTLDLDARRKSLSSREDKPATAYLQYTSGSTRTPAGVMVTNRRYEYLSPLRCGCVLPACRANRVRTRRAGGQGRPTGAGSS